MCLTVSSRVLLLYFLSCTAFNFSRVSNRLLKNVIYLHYVLYVLSIRLEVLLIPSWELPFQQLLKEKFLSSTLAHWVTVPTAVTTFLCFLGHLRPLCTSLVGLKFLPSLRTSFPAGRVPHNAEEITHETTFLVL